METILCLLPLTDAERAAFLAAAPDCRLLFHPIPTYRYGIEAVTQEEVSQATVILGNPPKALLRHAPHLKWLQTWSSGVDYVLEEGAFPPGAMLSSAAGAHGQGVAEVMLATLLALMKRLPLYRDDQRAHRWADEGKVKSPVGERMLILGTGDLGGSFAKLVRALGAYTVGLDRHPDRPAPDFDEHRSIAELDALLPQADVVAAFLPGTPETFHILDARRIAAMKDDAILLNAGRGSAVDCLALAQALDRGRLWGAGLDVTEEEPLPPDHPLWDCPGLLLTPHIGGGYRLDATLRAVNALALDNLRRYLAGEPLRNRVL